MIDWLCGLLVFRSCGLSDGLFSDIEETALLTNEESVIAMMGIGLDADLVCHLLLHSDLYEFWRWLLGLAVNVVVLWLFRLGFAWGWSWSWLAYKGGILRRGGRLFNCGVVD